jgi:hypothetical protein
MMQATEDVPGPLSKWYRHISNGAWPFSNRDHGWPISDCTSEGRSTLLSLLALMAWRLRLWIHVSFLLCVS